MSSDKPVPTTSEHTSLTPTGTAPVRGVMVVVPTYNERENIAELLPQLLALPSGGLRLEVLVVDDNSPDGTGEYVREFGQADSRVHLLSRPGKQGLGRAYIAGFAEALSYPWVDAVLQMDADFSHDPKFIPRFLELIQQKDVVVGSRYLNGISVVNWPLSRLVLSLCANYYASWVTGVKLSDITGGFRCFRRKVLEAIPPSSIGSVGYAFQIEYNFRAWRAGYSFGETPIIFVDRHSGTSKLERTLVREAFWMVWKLRFGKWLKPLGLA